MRRVFLILLWSVLGVVGAVRAQSFLGTIRGTVVDPQGGAATAGGNMPEPKFTGLDVSEQNIRVFGNAAVVVEKASVKGTINTPSGDQSIDGDYRVTHVWVKEGGQWKMASGQVTKIAAPGGM